MLPQNGRGGGGSPGPSQSVLLPSSPSPPHLQYSVCWNRVMNIWANATRMTINAIKKATRRCTTYSTPPTKTAKSMNILLRKNRKLIHNRRSDRDEKVRNNCESPFPVCIKTEKITTTRMNTTSSQLVGSYSHVWNNPRDSRDSICTTSLTRKYMAPMYRGRRDSYGTARSSSGTPVTLSAITYASGNLFWIDFSTTMEYVTITMMRKYRSNRMIAVGNRWEILSFNKF
mmetsp:Transcript_37014/g.75514  ORF Transcript_37014/g.75514 Transcript_37014/m.75514 type:complete len:229 (-) Transcript_37014:51-737(-)